MNNSEFFNILDYIYIGIMLLSALIGVFRGFSRDCFGTCAWLLSGFLSVFAAPVLYEPVGKYVTDPLLLRGVCLIMAFLMLLAIFLLMTSLISSRVKESVFSGVDRAGGALFGLIRGMFIVFSVFIILLIFEVPQDRFAVVRDSKITSVLFAHATEVVSVMEKIKLVPKGYSSKVLKARASKAEKRASSVNGLVPEIISEHIGKYKKKAKKNKNDSEDGTQQEAPRGYLSLSEAIAKRRREKQQNTSQNNMADDREADYPLKKYCVFYIFVS